MRGSNTHTYGNRSGEGRRAFLKGIGGVGIMAGASAIAGCLSEVGPEPGEGDSVNLTFASFDEGTGWYVMASTIGEHLSDHLPQGSNVSVRPFGGSIGSIELLRDDSADLAINHPVTTQWAMNGEYVFEGEDPHENLRGLVGHLDTYWTLVGLREGFAAEHGIESFADIREAQPAMTLGIGPTGGVSNEGTRMAFEAHDIQVPDDIEGWGGTVEFMGLGDMPSAMQGGNVDAIGWVATPGHPTWTEIVTSVDTRFLSIENKEYMLERGWMDMPDMPEGEFENDQPVAAPGWRSTLLTDTDLPNHAANAVAETVDQETESIVDAYAAMKVFDPEKGSQKEWLGVELHEGALEYWEEAGYR